MATPDPCMVRYSPRRLRFWVQPLHLDVLVGVLYGDHPRDELARLEAEYRALPSRHICMCEHRCPACVDWRQNYQPYIHAPVEYAARLNRLVTPSPDEGILDLLAARQRFSRADDMAKWLNGELVA